MSGKVKTPNLGVTTSHNKNFASMPLRLGFF